MAQSLRRNQPLWFTLVGIVVGLLVAGLAIPAVVGTDSDRVALEGADPDDGSESLFPGEDGAPAAPGAGQDSGGVAAGADDPDDPETSVVGGPDRQAPGSPGAPGAESAQAGAAEGATAPTADEPAPGRTTGLTATDRGVSAEAIRLGILIFDLGGASAIGFSVPGADPEEQREGWEAWVGDQNARGGIHGRQIEPHYYQYDVLDADSQRAACLRATQDDEVFAVLDVGSVQEVALCFTQENGTPFITQGGPGFNERHYQRAGGLLFSTLPEGRRGLANFAWELHRMGELQTEGVAGQQARKPVGILSSGQPGHRQTIQAGLADELEELGYTIAHWAELSPEPGVSQAQVPTAVNQMRAQGVEAVLLLVSIFDAVPFVHQANAQRWDPDYYASDWAGQSSQASANNMPPDFNGKLITTLRVGEIESGFTPPPMAADCMRVYSEQVGRDESGDQPIQNWVRWHTCQNFRIFVQGAEAAGPELTRGSLVGGLQSLGEIPMSINGGGSLRPGKFGIADLVRTAAYNPGCRCWLPVDDFRQPRYP